MAEREMLAQEGGGADHAGHCGGVFGGVSWWRLLGCGVCEMVMGGPASEVIRNEGTGNGEWGMGSGLY